jgi:putative spermidine/putrescine transport system substrate-binding protein
LNRTTIAVLAVLLAACRVGSDTTTTGDVTTTTPAATTTADESSPDNGIDALIAAARAEGNLNTIGLPHEYCNYGAVIEGFEAKYGIEVNELDPAAGPAEMFAAIAGNHGNPGEEAPDVVDLGQPFGPEARAMGLLQPYEVEVWDTIPDHVRDADGFWYGGYYGVMAFEVNSDAVSVPAAWSDLLDPEYLGKVALAGDPRVSNQAIFAVYAASLANGGSLDDAGPGLDYFAQLNDTGNLAPVIGEPQSIAEGETPLTIRWTYNALPNRDANAALVPIEVVVPATGRLAGVYVQAISASAPHINAAKLWMEYLFSDEGQTSWLEGYCFPIRYDDLIERRVVPGDLAARLPDVTGAAFPSVDQLGAARELITTNWEIVVGNFGG